VGIVQSAKEAPGQSARSLSKIVESQVVGIREHAEIPREQQEIRHFRERTERDVGEAPKLPWSSFRSAFGQIRGDG